MSLGADKQPGKLVQEKDITRELLTPEYGIYEFWRNLVEFRNRGMSKNLPQS